MVFADFGVFFTFFEILRRVVSKEGAFCLWSNPKKNFFCFCTHIYQFAEKINVVWLVLRFLTIFCHFWAFFGHFSDHSPSDVSGYPPNGFHPIHSILWGDTPPIETNFHPKTSIRPQLGQLKMLKPHFLPSATPGS